MDPDTWKRMRLRYAGVCRECGEVVAQGDPAVYDKAARNVICANCADRCSTEEPGTMLQVESAPIDPGNAGASARREFERRSAKREQRIRSAHPRIGGLILALSDDPQSTTAWRRGAAGEERLGGILDALTDQGVRALHDRRIPRSRANIDHIAIGAAGVFVIDAKRYQGRPSLRVDGGILRPRTETLMVARRCKNGLVDGMHRQLAAVQSVIGSDVPISGMLVFLDADWPLIGGAFVTQQVTVLWPKKMVEKITQPGPLESSDIDGLHRVLATALPPA